MVIAITHDRNKTRCHQRSEEKQDQQNRIWCPLFLLFTVFLFLYLQLEREKTPPPRLVSSEFTIFYICTPKCGQQAFSSTRCRCHLVTQCMEMLAVVTHFSWQTHCSRTLMAFSCQLLELPLQGLSLSSSHKQDIREVLRS